MERVTELIQQGSVALSVGEMERAEELFREATVQAPENIEAWLGLASAVTPLQEKRRCFERVLSLDPVNTEAQAGIDWIEQNSPQEHDHDLVTTEGDVLYCANHPDTETLLRCNRCNKPICTRCAVLTPVGHRCPECIAEQRRVFFTGTTADYPVAAIVGFVVAGIVGLIFSIIAGGLGFFAFWIAILVGPAVGGGVAEIIRKAIGRRRSQYLGIVAAVSVVLGAITGPGLVAVIAAIGRGAPLATLLLAPFVSVGRIDLLIFTALAVMTVYARLR